MGRISRSKSTGLAGASPGAAERSRTKTSAPKPHALNFIACHYSSDCRQTASNRVLLPSLQRFSVYDPNLLAIRVDGQHLATHVPLHFAAGNGFRAPGPEFEPLRRAGVVFRVLNRVIPVLDFLDDRAGPQ